MQKPYRLIFLFTIVSFLGFADDEIGRPPFTQRSSDQPDLMIHNLPLARINKKVISLYDVVKKMDLFLFEHYPNLNDLSPMEKYQFYMNRWEPTLNDMIDDELIFLDAQDKEIKISDGEVREALEERFGPKIMSNLHRVNYDYEEARTMIRQELTVQQLVGMKVHSKAFQATTPQAIKMAYEKYLDKNPSREEWRYRVLSIRGKDQERCKDIAEKGYNLLKEEGQPIEKLPSMLEEDGVTVSLSDDYNGKSDKLSKMHFDVIKALPPNSYSPPVLQVSRYDNSAVMRIFYLKDIVKNLPETFEQMHDRLKNKLLHETSDKEKAVYVQSLQKRFGYENHSPKFELPEDYQPFVLSFE
ncbi:MAG: hypothetical protein AAGE99_05770 [Chlamydiota bacterium]